MATGAVLPSGAPQVAGQIQPAQVLQERREQVHRLQALVKRLLGQELETWQPANPDLHFLGRAWRLLRDVDVKAMQMEACCNLIGPYLEKTPSLKAPEEAASGSSSIFPDGFKEQLEQAVVPLSQDIQEARALVDNLGQAHPWGFLGILAQAPCKYSGDIPKWHDGMWEMAKFALGVSVEKVKSLDEANRLMSYFNQEFALFDTFHNSFPSPDHILVLCLKWAIECACVRQLFEQGQPIKDSKLEYLHMKWQMLWVDFALVKATAEDCANEAALADFSPGKLEQEALDASSTMINEHLSPYELLPQQLHERWSAAYDDQTFYKEVAIERLGSLIGCFIDHEKLEQQSTPLPSMKDYREGEEVLVHRPDKSRKEIGGERVIAGIIAGLKAAAITAISHEDSKKVPDPNALADEHGYSSNQIKRFYALQKAAREKGIRIGPAPKEKDSAKKEEAKQAPKPPAQPSSEEVDPGAFKMRVNADRLAAMKRRL